MTAPLSFQITSTCRESAARVGRVETPHGGFDTPAFMVVGTRASVRGLLPQQVRDAGTQIVLNNAYHLMLRPGDDLIARRGGVHRFMGWDGPVLTDSGGYQAFSMADINDSDADGVTFRSIIDGAQIRLTPERSMEVQHNLGADIIMAFDDCPPGDRAEGGGRRTEDGGQRPGDGKQGPGARPLAPGSAEGSRSMSEAGDSSAPAHRRRLEVANERTVRWLERCLAAHERGGRAGEQALFGIVQGGTELDLRDQSAQAIRVFDLPGYAIGGVAVGEGAEEIRAVVEFTAPLLPADRPRYLMGVGYERDLVTAVRAGVDMFDCVLPTRNGRNANVFTRTGRLHLRNAAHAEDDGPIENGCPCPACRGGFSRAYLRHLFMAGEMLGPILASLHNITHFQRLMLDIRRAIAQDDWFAFYGSWPVLGGPEVRV